MKIESVQSELDHQTNVAGEWVGGCVNAEETDQGMSEIIVKVEVDGPSSPEASTVSCPEEDLFLFAPVSDFEDDGDGQNWDSDSSGVPPDKQHTRLCLLDAGRTIKSEKRSEEKSTVPKPERKSRRKKKETTKKEAPCSNSQPKVQKTKKTTLKKTTNVQPQAESKLSVATAGLVSAPYTITKTAISPQVAMEPPSFPSPQVKTEGSRMDEKNGVLFQVFQYCQSLSTAVQRLEQKIDSLQADCTRLYQHIHRDGPKEQHSALWEKEQPPMQWGQMGASTYATYTLNPPLSFPQASIPGNLNVHRPGPNNTLNALQSNANGGEAEKTKGTKTTGRGKGRAVKTEEGTSKGAKAGGQSNRSRKGGAQKGPARKRTANGKASQSKRDADLSHDDESPCASKVAKILSELQERRTTAVRSPVEESREASKDTSATSSQDKQVMIGSAFRKVWIPYSVYMEAFKQEEPQKAMVPVLHAVFPHSVLTSSAVIGDPHRGIQQLSPNKLEAIREWLAEMYPRHEMEVKGKSWADCLGVLNTITRKLKMETTSATTSAIANTLYIEKTPG